MQRRQQFCKAQNCTMARHRLRWVNQLRRNTVNPTGKGMNALTASLILCSAVRHTHQLISLNVDCKPGLAEHYTSALPI